MMVAGTDLALANVIDWDYFNTVKQIIINGSIYIARDILIKLEYNKNIRP